MEDFLVTYVESVFLVTVVGMEENFEKFRFLWNLFHQSRHLRNPPLTFQRDGLKFLLMESDHKKSVSP